MREKRLFHCKLCERMVSLWRARDGRLLCPRCSKEVITHGDTIVAVKAKDGSTHKGA